MIGVWIPIQLALSFTNNLVVSCPQLDMPISTAEPQSVGKPRRNAGLSPCPTAQSTTTGAPTLTRLNRSVTSSFNILMQPDDTAWPMVQGSLEP